MALMIDVGFVVAIAPLALFCLIVPWLLLVDTIRSFWRCR